MEPEGEDELSAENKALVHWMQRVVRSAAVRNLLVGNDTGCFTTEQYKVAYREECDRMFRVRSPVDEWQFMRPEDHLQGLPHLVREVKPGLWAAK